MANEKPNLSYSDFYTFNSNPTATVNPAKVGVVWINNKDKKIFICTDNTLNKNKWEETPNMALLEGKVEDALKELEDMTQEIRTYASGLEYRKRILEANKTYSWEYDVELELSPELFYGSATVNGMEMQFYINNSYYPVAYCHIPNGWRLNSTLYMSCVLGTQYNAPYIHLYNCEAISHRCSVSGLLSIRVTDYTNYNSRFRYLRTYQAADDGSGGGVNTTEAYVYVLTAQDHADLAKLGGVSIGDYTIKNYYTVGYRGYGTGSINRLILAEPIIYPSIINNITNYGVSYTDYLNHIYCKSYIPWYLYYGKETSETEYSSKFSAYSLESSLLERIGRCITGNSYTIRLKAGETFRFRTRFCTYRPPTNYAWTGWVKSLLPVGYMAPKPVTYIN